jgi:hypothetical protein
MRKRAGSFLKNMMSKGKNLFKKDEEAKEGAGNGDDGGFDSEEDKDIIEVRKKGGGPIQMPGNSFISNHSSGGSGSNNLSTNVVTHVHTSNNPGIKNLDAPSSGGISSTKHLLMEFANNTLLAADNLIHGTNSTENTSKKL